MTQERYFIGPGLRDKLRETITRVDGLIASESGANVPTVLQDLPRRGDKNSVRLCKTNAVWERDTIATLDVWEEGTPPSETQSTGQTVEAVNKMHKVAAGTWVVVARCTNGSWYLVEAGDNEPESPEGEGDACVPPSISGRDLTDITGYDSDKTQALSHAQGCLKWIDVADCPTATSSTATFYKYMPDGDPANEYCAEPNQPENYHNDNTPLSGPYDTQAECEGA